MTSNSPDIGEILDRRRRRLRFRAWHRGTKEADLILGRFVDLHIASMDHDDVDWFERLLEEQDQDILGWITGKDAPPAVFDTPMMAAMRKLDYVSFDRQTESGDRT